MMPLSRTTKTIRMTRCAAASTATARGPASTTILPPYSRERAPAQDDDGEEEMDDELQDETEEEFDGDQTEPEY